jgi:predicted CoA-substrate-specific enzyme activase
MRSKSFSGTPERVPQRQTGGESVKNDFDDRFVPTHCGGMEPKMITAGIDAGFENTKVVLLRGDEIAARGIARTRTAGEKRAKAIASLWLGTLRSAGLSAADIGKVAATGHGKSDVGFADEMVVEAVADARAARFFYPAAQCVVDIGADQILVVTLGEGNAIREVVFNQKCAAGIGTFLAFMADRLAFSPEEMGALPPNAPEGVFVNDGCPVFAELDALCLLRAGVSPENVARAVVEASAVRINSVLNDKLVPEKETTVLVGGLTKNAALVRALKTRSGINFLIPIQAEYGCAAGAALVAGDSLQNRGWL